MLTCAFRKIHKVHQLFLSISEIHIGNQENLCAVPVYSISINGDALTSHATHTVITFCFPPPILTTPSNPDSDPALSLNFCIFVTFVVTNFWK